MKTYSITDTGILREMNQDYFFASDEPVGNLPNLYIVADGMGGHKAGDYASRYTTQRIVASVSRSSGEEPVTILKEAITTANRLLITEAAEDEAKKGMGTTLVAATIIDGRLYVANVGDSRLRNSSERWVRWSSAVRYCPWIPVTSRTRRRLLFSISLILPIL